MSNSPKKSQTKEQLIVPDSPKSPKSEEETTQLTKIILVKGVPYGIEKSTLEQKMEKWGKIKRILSKPSTSHFYIEYRVKKLLNN